MSQLDPPREFGPGEAGAKARALIAASAQCVECGKSATHTIDYDVLGQLDFVAVCKNCLSTVRDAIAADLTKSGRDPYLTLGINGWGRA